ncbi:hypothetical protein [Kineosporia rhizophila]|nr:hypothetical protein [Kineosporia rhizophila]
MTFPVPEGLMSRLVFTDEPVPEDEVVPRIPADLPLIFTPEEPV